MANRKSLSKKIRFEVFKRDKFTCQYCGKSAPDVVLHVDHMKPVSKGGTNAILNLITACFDCNSGKSDFILSDDSVISKQKKQLDLLQDRREQMQMMMEWQEGLNRIEQEKIALLKAYWENLTPGYHLSETGQQRIKKLLSEFQMDLIMQAMNISATSYLQWENKQLTEDSVASAVVKIAAICRIELASKENPDLKEFYYIRGIIRNRCNYHDPQLTLDWLAAAKSWGASIEELKSLAKQATSWTNFSDRIDAIISRYKSEDNG